MGESYLRMPHVVDATVVFVADNDVWSAPTTGGPAARLTNDGAPALNPRLSPDGTHLAWTSRRNGLPDTYVVPLAGGAPIRLTFSGNTKLLGWLDNGHALIVSAAQQPFRSRTWAYSLPIDGGPAERLPYGPIGGIALSPHGTVLQSVSKSAAEWKRYRGGTRQKLSLGTGERFLAELDGQVGEPVWVGDRLLFISDHELHGNIYSTLADGSDLRRHSDHEGLYARALSGNLDGTGTTAVYAHAGVVHQLTDLGPAGRPRALEIELPGTRKGRQPTRVETTIELDMSLDAEGRGSAVGVRGTVQWLPHRDGPARVLAESPGVRTRLPQVVPGLARTAVWITDADGDDRVELGDGLTTRRFAAGPLGRVTELAVAPDGSAVALTATDGRVLIVNLDSGALTEVARETSMAAFPSWSPDSRWLVWSAPGVAELRNLRLAEVATGAVTEVTPARFTDVDPVFTLDGKHLAFLSYRTFDPVYDEHSFDLSFPRSVRPYVIPLTLAAATPFAPELDGRAVKPASTDDDAEVAPVTAIDLAGLALRVTALPVAAGLYSKLRATKGGLSWLSKPVAGNLGEDSKSGEKPRFSLQHWGFAERKESTLVPALEGYEVSADGIRMLVGDKDGDAIRVLPAERAAAPGADGEPSADVVTVDLTRTAVTVDPVAEWRQMVVETWRLMRDHFWVEDMAGMDWDGVLDRYLPLVDRLATRDDLSELIWEMQGELGTSHAYEIPKPAPPAAGHRPAYLGADLSPAADGGWRVERVLHSESSVRAARSPLEAPSADVRPGDVVISINGRPIPAIGPAPLLLGTAELPVELTVSRDGATRSVVVTPLAEETPLRYQDWVAGCRARVREWGGGRIGYIHIPDMMSSGWAEFHRDLKFELDFDALVVDTRDNGGGHTSQLVLERLSRPTLGANVDRHGPTTRWPGEAPAGPMVSLANEQAGSDGDIVNAGFRALGLGTIIGTRTWGGVIGIDGMFELVDGTTVTQPRYSFWFADTGWTVENYGVDPDIEVGIPPAAWAAGEDPQLFEGVRVLLAQLAASKTVSMPDPASRPSRAVPPLPPR